MNHLPGLTQESNLILRNLVSPKKPRSSKGSLRHEGDAEDRLYVAVVNDDILLNRVKQG